MNKRTKKLTLTRERVRVLTTRELPAVAGGTVLATVDDPATGAQTMTAQIWCLKGR